MKYKYYINNNSGANHLNSILCVPDQHIRSGKYQQSLVAGEDVCWAVIEGHVELPKSFCIQPIYICLGMTVWLK